MNPTDDAHRNLSHHGNPKRATLPDELRSTLEEFLAYDGIATVTDWVDAIKETFGNPALTQDDLCYTEGTSPHRAILDGTVHNFSCCYDAMILSALTDRPVQIATVSPSGATIRAWCDEHTVDVDPSGAICSFGIERDPPQTKPGNPTLEDGYSAMCPYVRMFPSDQDYRNWAMDVPASTIALPVSDGMAFADQLVRP